MVGIGTSSSREAAADPAAVPTTPEDAIFDARWDAAVKALQAVPGATPAELLEALTASVTDLRLRAAVARLMFWLYGLIGGNKASSARTVVRTYRRHVKREAARAARPKRPETRNEFERGRGEVVRATVAQFRGKRSLHLRTWFKGRDGAMRATTRGIAIAPELLHELEAAVRSLRNAVERLEAEAGDEPGDPGLLEIRGLRGWRG